MKYNIFKCWRLVSYLSLSANHWRDAIPLTTLLNKKLFCIHKPGRESVGKESPPPSQLVVCRCKQPCFLHYCRQFYPLSTSRSPSITFFLRIFQIFRPLSCWVAAVNNHAFSTTADNSIPSTSRSPSFTFFLLIFLVFFRPQEMEGYVDILGTREQWSDIGRSNRTANEMYRRYYFLLELWNSSTVIFLL